MKLIKIASGKTKLKISKKEWKDIGKKAGWMKKAQQDTPTTEEIIDSILKGENPYFSYKHFLSSNMSDYSLMKGTIEDLRDVYDIDELVAADIVQKLTH